MNPFLPREEIQKRDKNDRIHLAQTVDARTISILKRKFGTDKACFLPGPNGYDPMDAMRRDAHREVFLVIRRQLSLAERESTPTTTTNTEQDET